MTEFNPVLYAAVALHPAMKFDQFNIAWAEHPQWIDDAQQIVRNLWLDIDKPEYSATLPNTPLPMSETTDHPVFNAWKHKRATNVMRDELEEFLSLRTVNSIHDPRLWWLEHRTDYPALSQMALDILAVPAMLAEVERVFSSASLTIADPHNQLGGEVVEAIGCPKSWLQSGMIELTKAEEIQRMLE